MPPPQVADALESCSHRHQTGGLIPSTFFKVPNLLRLALDRSLRAATCHPKHRTYYRPLPSPSKNRPTLRSSDREPSSSEPTQPSGDRTGGHISHEAVRADCPVCCSRLQPTKLPTFETSHAREHLPDFLYVIDLSVPDAPEMYVREWPRLPKDMDGCLDDLGAYFVRGGIMPNIAHLRLYGTEPVRMDHHACSYYAELSFRDRTSGLLHRRRVVAKVAHQRCVDQGILRREAWLSEAFPHVVGDVRGRAHSSRRRTVSSPHSTLSAKLLGLYVPQGRHAPQDHRGCSSPWKCFRSPPVLLVEDRDTSSRGRSSTHKELCSSRLPVASSLRHGNEDVLTRRHRAAFLPISHLIERVHAFKGIEFASER